MKLCENIANILLHHTKDTTYVEAAAEKETIHNTESEDGAGARASQHQICEGKELRICGKFG